MPSRWSRRDLIRTGGTGAAATLLDQAKAAPPDPVNPYLRIGVRPFINMTAGLTINGGIQTLPEVKQAMDAASHFSVNIDELMEKVGERLATLLGSEAAMVTSGAAGALTHATSACVAGGDPEKLQQLPGLTGLKDEAVTTRQSRNVYDHAIRTVGVKMIDTDSREQFLAALGPRTALVWVLGQAEPRGKIRLEEMAEAAHKRGIPVLVDGAPEVPRIPNPYLSRGADLVAYSGGKIISGPQCAGLLLGRKDLVRAAWTNSAPHHAFGRALKVGKEEIVGMLAAVEALMKTRDLQAERRAQQAGLDEIRERIGSVPGVKAANGPTEGGPFPVLQVQWDPARIGFNAGELQKLLLDGEPRIMTQAAGEGYSFPLRASGNVKPGDYKLVADRLYRVFTQAKGRTQPAAAPPTANVTGRWDVEIQFSYGSSRHTLTIESEGNRLKGSHEGRVIKADLSGTLDGGRIRLASSFPMQGASLRYVFSGSATGDTMSGEVTLGEYGSARWTARRQQV